MSILESTRKMTTNEKMCYDMGYAQGKQDAVPVVRGEWLVTDAYPHRVYCSVCYKTNVPNEEWLYEKNDYPKYCMWCGAKMEDKP